MTELLILVIVLTVLAADLATGVRWVRADRPVVPPRSHHDWSAGALPSRSYAQPR